MSQSKVILEVSNLCVDLRRGKQQSTILDAINFSVNERGFYGIIGESGSGKSVLCQSLIDALHPPLSISDGSVLFRGEDLLTMQPNRLQGLRGDRIGYIGANPFSAFDPTMTVGSQLVEKLLHKKPGIIKSEARERVVDLLDAVRIPDPHVRFNEYPHQFSGGMIQRAMIVDALLSEPDLIIADNVTLPLDVTVAAQILILFQELRERVSAAFVFVSSSLPVVMEVADEISILQNGKIIERTSPKQILISPHSDYAKHLVASVPRIWSLTEAEQHRPKPSDNAESNQAVLEIDGVFKTYRTRVRNAFFKFNEVQAVRGVNLVINRGESFGLVGESGCGKSTLSRLLTWLEAPDSGVIKFLGGDVQKLDRHERFGKRRRFQLLLQDPYNSIPPHLTVGRTITEPLFVHENVSRKEARNRAEKVMCEVGLDMALFDELPTSMSAGERQRVNIARAMIMEPELMILDETLTSLDHGEQKSLLDLFDRLQVEHNLTYIYISHDLAMVRRACDRVAVMYLGKIVELGKTQQIFEEPTHPYTKALLSALATIEEKPFRQEECLLDGEPPSPINLPPGCSFENRCPHAIKVCRVESPPETVFASNSMRACHLDLSVFKRN